MFVPERTGSSGHSRIPLTRPDLCSGRSGLARDDLLSNGCDAREFTRAYGTSLWPQGQGVVMSRDALALVSLLSHKHGYCQGPLGGRSYG
jgi:hypothetical protein